MYRYFYSDVADYSKAILYLFLINAITGFSIAVKIFGIKDDTFVDLNSLGNRILFYGLLSVPILYFGFFVPAFKAWRLQGRLYKDVLEFEDDSEEQNTVMKRNVKRMKKLLMTIVVGTGVSTFLLVVFIFKFNESEFFDAVFHPSILGFPTVFVVTYLIFKVYSRMGNKEDRVAMDEQRAVE